MFISVSDTFIEHTKTTCMGYRCLRKKRPSHGIRNVMETPPLPPISKLNWLTRLASAKMDVFFADRSTHRSGPCNIELRGCGGHWAALVCQTDVFFANTGLGIWKEYHASKANSMFQLWSPGSSHLYASEDAAGSSRSFMA